MAGASPHQPPLVAISIRRGLRSETNSIIHFVGETYLNAVVSFGLIPVFVPPTLSEDQIRALYARVDGVLLTGGGDMQPHLSGLSADDPDCSLAGDVDPARDAAELALARWAWADDKPLFGICRGHQVMNVALGGTLMMDIQARLNSSVKHEVANDPYWRRELLHSVTISPQTRLAEIIKADDLPVNSIHHQAIDKLAPDLQATAYAPDGIIEAIESPAHRFYLGVQWHPEEIYSDSPTQQALFRAFAEAMH